MPGKLSEGGTGPGELDEIEDIGAMAEVISLLKT